MISTTPQRDGRTGHATGTVTLERLLGTFDAVIRSLPSGTARQRLEDDHIRVAGQLSRFRLEIEKRTIGRSARS